MGSFSTARGGGEASVKSTISGAGVSASYSSISGIMYYVYSLSPNTEVTLYDETISVSVGDIVVVFFCIDVRLSALIKLYIDGVLAKSVSWSQQYSYNRLITIVHTFKATKTSYNIKVTGSSPESSSGYAFPRDDNQYTGSSPAGDLRIVVIGT